MIVQYFFDVRFAPLILADTSNCFKGGVKQSMQHAVLQFHNITCYVGSSLLLGSIYLLFFLDVTQMSWVRTLI